MTTNIEYHDLPCTPDLLDGLINKLKNKMINITNSVLLSSMNGMSQIAYNEIVKLRELYEQDRINYTLEDMQKLNFDSIYDQLENTEDKLWIIHTDLKDSKDKDLIKLFKTVDKILDNLATINNILGYFESQIIQDKLKSA